LREIAKNTVDEYPNYLDVPVVDAWHLLDNSTWLLITEITQSEAYMAMNSLSAIICSGIHDFILCLSHRAYSCAPNHDSDTICPVN
jgi:hypothetical protein